jgi:hypothetical protein
MNTQGFWIRPWNLRRSLDGPAKNVGEDERKSSLVGQSSSKAMLPNPYRVYSFLHVVYLLLTWAPSSAILDLAIVFETAAKARVWIYWYHC